MREKRGREERKKTAATSENGRKDMTFDQIILWVMAAGVIIGAADKIFGNRLGLGEKFDFLMAICDSKLWLDQCHMLPLCRCQKMCAVSREHRLAGKKQLALSDLYGETLMMVKQGDSRTNDRIRADLTRDHPAIQIEDTPQFYDISVFNRCAETGNVLLILDCWQDVHPALVSIPVDWEYSSPYGLLYALEPSEGVSRFVEAVRKEIGHGA